MSRSEALKKLGLYAPHDFVSGTVAILLVLGAAVCLVVALDHPMLILGLLLSAVLVLLQWLIVLIYRVGVFVLDTHADISLMPETAARIAVAFLKGQPAPPPTGVAAVANATLNRRPPGP